MNTIYAQLAKHLPTWFYKLLAQSWIDYKYPRHLFIETTATCNLSCSYCPREKIRQDMDFNLFKEIIDEASRYGVRSFSLHLFGEPLLYPKIKDAVTYIKKANRRHRILLTTNGTKLNELFDSVKEADQIYWTWRKESKFTDKTKEKLRRWGKFRVRFIDEITPEAAKREWKDWKNIERRRIHNYGGQIDLSPYGVPSMERRWPCYHLWLAPAVAWNGNILMCCADPHHKEVMGKFPGDSIESFWRSSRLKEIRDSHKAGVYKGICEKCDVWKEYPNIW